MMRLRTIIDADKVFFVLSTILAVGATMCISNFSWRVKFGTAVLISIGTGAIYLFGPRIVTNGRRTLLVGFAVLINTFLWVAPGRRIWLLPDNKVSTLAIQNGQLNSIQDYEIVRWLYDHIRNRELCLPSGIENTSGIENKMFVLLNIKHSTVMWTGVTNVKLRKYNWILSDYHMRQLTQLTNVPLSETQIGDYLLVFVPGPDRSFCLAQYENKVIVLPISYLSQIIGENLSNQ